MNGFETPSLVRAQITALERELTNPYRGDDHAEGIRKSLEIFQAELARMEKEGVTDIPDNNNPAHGRRDYHGAWVGRS